MKQTLFTFLIISVFGLVSCRKDKIQLTIKQYDQQQIANYMAANGLTGVMHRDLTGGDTSGIYYQILYPGTQFINGKAVDTLDYPTKVAFVYTERTLDGTYVQADTIANHFYDYVGHISSDNYPLGLQTAVHNLLKYPDASMRVLIPSHLAYGINGTGSGSSTVANNKINGNECMDFYIHAVNNFQTYDNLVIQNYRNANGLTTGYIGVKLPVQNPDPLFYWVGKYSKPPILDSGTYYYAILTPPSATTDSITNNSVITATYTGQIFNGTIFDSGFNGLNPYIGPVNGFIPGVMDGLEKHAFVGTKISLLIPSSLGYGLQSQTSIPPFSCLRFTWVVTAVTP